MLSEISYRTRGVQSTNHSIHFSNAVPMERNNSSCTWGVSCRSRLAEFISHTGCGTIVAMVVTAARLNGSVLRTLI